jgi:hypothetical protein
MKIEMYIDEKDCEYKDKMTAVAFLKLIRHLNLSKSDVLLTFHILKHAINKHLLTTPIGDDVFDKVSI